MKHAISLILLLLFTFSLHAQSVIKPGVFYKIRNYKSQMDISNSGLTNNASWLRQIKNVGQDGHWEFIRQGAYYQIRNKTSRMYISNFEQLHHGAIMKQTSDPNDGALWRIISTNMGLIQIQNKLSGLYLANRRMMNGGTPIFQVENPAEGALWKLHLVKSETKTLPQKNQKVLDGKQSPFLRINYLRKHVDVDRSMETRPMIVGERSAFDESIDVVLGKRLKLDWGISFKGVGTPVVYFNGRDVSTEVKRASDGSYWMSGFVSELPAVNAELRREYTLRVTAEPLTGIDRTVLVTEKTIIVDLLFPEYRLDD